MRMRILVCAVLMCAATVPLNARSEKNRAPKAAAPDLVWPLPPDPPKIRFVETLQGSRDFAKKKSKWKRLLVGSEPDDGITLLKPYGVVTDARGRIYVSDTGLGAVVVFDREKREVHALGVAGRVHLVTPIGLAIDEKGRLFVSDAVLDTVFCFDGGEKVVLALGRSEGLKNPAGLAVDKSRHRLYVADSHLHQILVYTTDGQFLERWGSRGSAPGQFNFPTNLSTDASGNLVVVDTGNFRVQILDPEGHAISSFGHAGGGSGSFHRPKGVGVDSEGHLYVVDAAFNNFQIFDRQGQLLLFVGQAGTEPGTFWLPAGIYIDGQDHIFVVDQINRRVQVFRYLGG